MNGPYVTNLKKSLWKRNLIFILIINKFNRNLLCYWTGWISNMKFQQIGVRDTWLINYQYSCGTEILNIHQNTQELFQHNTAKWKIHSLIGISKIIISPQIMKLLSKAGKLLVVGIRPIVHLWDLSLYWGCLLWGVYLRDPSPYLRERTNSGKNTLKL